MLTTTEKKQLAFCYLNTAVDTRKIQHVLKLTDEEMTALKQAWLSGQLV